MRHVVIGTAGHVDHGKTALVRALTGEETDRLREEQERGITIELGFARCDLDGVEAGIVDVPGHEDFVRTMVAGATGIDVALLVVAADESVMPQTVEHAAILDFLGVRVGVVAITKTDLVEPGWLDLVRGEIRERLDGTGTRWTDVVPVSSVTGDGLAELRAALARAAGAAAERPAADLFRLPVDRAFSVAGAGTVVTGTVWSGHVQVGDEVTILPGGRRARVRGVQTHGRKQTSATPGRRTALALTGVEREEAPRGVAVVAGAGWRATDTLDVAVTLLPGAPALGQRARVRVHLGTAEVLARVTPAAAAVAPGGSGTVRLRLEEPVVARWGDRLVLRAYSPVTTIAGAVVGDPHPPPRPRRPADVQPLLADVPHRVAAAVDRAGRFGYPVADLTVRLGVPPGDVERVAASLAGAQRVGDRLVARAVVDRVKTAIADAVEAYHRRARLEPGMPKDQVRRAAPDAELADAALAALAADGRLVVEGAVVRAASHRVELDDADAAALGRMRNALRAAGFEGKEGADLAAESGPAGRALVEVLVRRGEAVRIGGDRFLEAGILQDVVAVVREVIGAMGQLGPAQLRDRLGLTRKFSIPLLEWLDGQGYTVRQGDARVAGPRLTGGSGAS